MIVTCPSCESRFQYGDERFMGASSKRFRCPKCGHTFEVLNPHAAPPPPPPPQAPPPPKATETSRRKGVDAMLTLANLKRDGMPPGLRFSLAFLSGPLASTVKVLESPVTVIGREEGDVVINDPEISRRHARVEIHPDGSVWLADLGSTNGTFLGSAPIAEPVKLHDRQEFSCGRSTFMLLVRDTNAIGLD
ncbi:MAG TPA: FHA domain-containing protein [Holophaga sp.]|nr:FHA domain-containing protein [Holophaga sp.]